MLPRMSPAALAEAPEATAPIAATQITATQITATAVADVLVEPADDLLDGESLIEEISIDGMCGVY